MKRIALFPGSFDPITNGHADIIEKGLTIFDKIIIGIGNNAEKKYMFSLAQREEWIKSRYQDNPRIEVSSYSGLTVEFCKQRGAGFILRGLRNAADFEFEKAIAHMNGAIAPAIETIFVLSDLKYGAISSSIIRDIIRNNGDVSQFVPFHFKQAGN